MLNYFSKTFLSISLTLLILCTLCPHNVTTDYVKDNRCYFVIENRSEYSLERSTSFLYKMLYFDFTFYIPAHSNGNGLIEPYEEDFGQTGRVNYNLIGTNYNIQIGLETFRNLQHNIYVKYNDLFNLGSAKINLGYGGDSHSEACLYYLMLSGYGRNFNISTFIL